MSFCVINCVTAPANAVLARTSKGFPISAVAAIADETNLDHVLNTSLNVDELSIEWRGPSVESNLNQRLILKSDDQNAIIQMLSENISCAIWEGRE